MYYTEKNILAAKISVKNSLREVFKGVFFGNGLTVATDRFSLVEIKALGQGDAPEHGPIILRADELKKMKCKKNATINLSNKKDGNTLIVSCEEGSHFIPVISDTFPEYEQIFPKEKPLARITLNAEYLKNMLAIFEELGEKVTIEFNGEMRPLVLRTESTARQSARAMVMPIKVS